MGRFGPDLAGSAGAISVNRDGPARFKTRLTGWVLGRDERSIMPARPSALKRPTPRHDLR